MKKAILLGLVAWGFISLPSYAELQYCDLALNESVSLRQDRAYQNEDTIPHKDPRALFWYQKIRLTQYLRNDEQRAPYLMSQLNGNIYQGKKRILGRALGLTSKTYMFVLGPDRKFYIDDEDYFAKLAFHHSSFFAGGDLLSAGEITIQGKRILSINLSSGHYRPYHSVMPQTLDALLKQGFQLPEKIEFSFDFIVLKDAIEKWNRGEEYAMNGAYSETIAAIQAILRHYGYLN